jgi:hypothetical protein
VKTAAMKSTHVILTPQWPSPVTRGRTPSASARTLRLTAHRTRHVHPNPLMMRLREIDIDLLGACNASLRGLVKEVPAPLVAEMLGYSSQVTQKHATAAAEPWSRYALVTSNSLAWRHSVNRNHGFRSNQSHASIALAFGRPTRSTTGTHVLFGTPSAKHSNARIVGWAAMASGSVPDKATALNKQQFLQVRPFKERAQP